MANRKSKQFIEKITMQTFDRTEQEDYIINEHLPSVFKDTHEFIFNDNRGYLLPDGLDVRIPYNRMLITFEDYYNNLNLTDINKEKYSNIINAYFNNHGLPECDIEPEENSVYTIYEYDEENKKGVFIDKIEKNYDKSAVSKALNRIKQRICISVVNSDKSVLCFTRHKH